MSKIDRAIATNKRERYWLVYDNVPPDQLRDGCSYCVDGWATGPGLVYRCDNCNSGTDSDPQIFSTEPEEVHMSMRERVARWWRGKS